SAGISFFNPVWLYLTNLWASVATKLILSDFISKNTPVSDGLRSSLAVAKIVFEIALTKVFELMSTGVISKTSFGFGNSAPLKYGKLYFPDVDMISTIPVSEMINCSG